ncbi:uncharacterized protein LOC132707924 isoform X2 [Cylas formicarius]|nr:uncharacterized protein LOC132707924 isoform X2 [Cylas formicarius]
MRKLLICYVELEMAVLSKPEFNRDSYITIAQDRVVRLLCLIYAEYSKFSPKTPGQNNSNDVWKLVCLLLEDVDLDTHNAVDGIRRMVFRRIDISKERTLSAGQVILNHMKLPRQYILDFEKMEEDDNESDDDETFPFDLQKLGVTQTERLKQKRETFQIPKPTPVSLEIGEGIKIELTLGPQQSSRMEDSTELVPTIDLTGGSAIEIFLPEKRVQDSARRRAQLERMAMIEEEKRVARDKIIAESWLKHRPKDINFQENNFKPLLANTIIDLLDSDDDDTPPPCNAICASSTTIKNEDVSLPAVLETETTHQTFSVNNTSKGVFTIRNESGSQNADVIISEKSERKKEEIIQEKKSEENETTVENAADTNLGNHGAQSIEKGISEFSSHNNEKKFIAIDIQRESEDKETATENGAYPNLDNGGPQTKVIEVASSEKPYIFQEVNVTLKEIQGKREEKETAMGNAADPNLNNDDTVTRDIKLEFPSNSHKKRVTEKDIQRKSEGILTLENEADTKLEDFQNIAIEGVSSDKKLEIIDVCSVTQNTKLEFPSNNNKKKLADKDIQGKIEDKESTIKNEADTNLVDFQYIEIEGVSSDEKLKIIEGESVSQNIEFVTLKDIEGKSEKNETAMGNATDPNLDNDRSQNIKIEGASSGEKLGIIEGMTKNIELEFLTNNNQNKVVEKDIERKSEEKASTMENVPCPNLYNDGSQNIEIERVSFNEKLEIIDEISVTQNIQSENNKKNVTGEDLQRNAEENESTMTNATDRNADDDVSQNIEIAKLSFDKEFEVCVTQNIEITLPSNKNNKDVTLMGIRGESKITFENETDLNMCNEASQINETVSLTSADVGPSKLDVGGDVYPENFRHRYQLGEEQNKKVNIVKKNIYSMEHILKTSNVSENVSIPHEIASCLSNIQDGDVAIDLSTDSRKNVEELLVSTKIETNQHAIGKGIGNESELLNVSKCSVDNKGVDSSCHVEAKLDGDDGIIYELCYKNANSSAITESESCLDLVGDRLIRPIYSSCFPVSPSEDFPKDETENTAKNETTNHGLNGGFDTQLFNNVKVTSEDLLLRLSQKNEVINNEIPDCKNDDGICNEDNDYFIFGTRSDIDRRTLSINICSDLEHCETNQERMPEKSGTTKNKCKQSPDLIGPQTEITLKDNLENVKSKVVGQEVSDLSEFKQSSRYIATTAGVLNTSIETIENPCINKEINPEENDSQGESLIDPKLSISTPEIAVEVETLCSNDSNELVDATGEAIEVNDDNDTSIKSIHAQETDCPQSSELFNNAGRVLNETVEKSVGEEMNSDCNDTCKQLVATYTEEVPNEDTNYPTGDSHEEPLSLDITEFELYDNENIVTSNAKIVVNEVIFDDNDANDSIFIPLPGVNSENEMEKHDSGNITLLATAASLQEKIPIKYRSAMKTIKNDVYKQIQCNGGIEDDRDNNDSDNLHIDEELESKVTTSCFDSYTFFGDQLVGESKKQSSPKKTFNTRHKRRQLKTSPKERQKEKSVSPVKIVSRKEGSTESQLSCSPRLLVTKASVKSFKYTCNTTVQSSDTDDDDTPLSKRIEKKTNCSVGNGLGKSNEKSKTPARPRGRPRKVPLEKNCKPVAERTECSPRLRKKSYDGHADVDTIGKCPQQNNQIMISPTITDMASQFSPRGKKLSKEGPLKLNPETNEGVQVSSKTKTKVELTTFNPSLTPKEKYKLALRAQLNQLSETSEAKPVVPPAKLRRKSENINFKQGAIVQKEATDLPTVNVHIDLLSNCKNTLKATADKLKRKLAGEDNFFAESVPKREKAKAVMLNSDENLSNDMVLRDIREEVSKVVSKLENTSLFNDTSNSIESNNQVLGQHDVQVNGTINRNGERENENTSPFYSMDKRQSASCNRRNSAFGDVKLIDTDKATKPVDSTVGDLSINVISIKSALSSMKSNSEAADRANPKKMQLEPSENKGTKESKTKNFDTIKKNQKHKRSRSNAEYKKSEDSSKSRPDDKHILDVNETSSDCRRKKKSNKLSNSYEKSKKEETLKTEKKQSKAGLSHVMNEKQKCRSKGDNTDRYSKKVEEKRESKERVKRGKEEKVNKNKIKTLNNTREDSNKNTNQNGKYVKENPISHHLISWIDDKLESSHFSQLGKNNYKFGCASREHQIITEKGVDLLQSGFKESVKHDDKPINTISIKESNPKTAKTSPVADVTYFDEAKANCCKKKTSKVVIGNFDNNITPMGNAMGMDEKESSARVSTENSNEDVKTDLYKLNVTKFDVTDTEGSALHYSGNISKGVNGSLTDNVTDTTALGMNPKTVRQTENIPNQYINSVSAENSSEDAKTNLCKFIVTKSDETDPKESSLHYGKDMLKGIIGSLPINATDMTAPDTDNNATQQTNDIPNHNVNRLVSTENSRENVKTDLCKFGVTKSDATGPEVSSDVVGCLAINVTDMTALSADHRLTQQTKNILNENNSIHISRENSTKHIKTDLCKFIVNKSDVTDPEESAGVVGSLAINFTDMTALGADTGLTQQTKHILNENNGIHVSGENSRDHIKTDLCKFIVNKSDVTDPEESAGMVGSLAINDTDMTALGADNRLTQQTTNILNENNGIHVSRENSGKYIKPDLCKFIVTKSDVTDPEESAGVVGSLAINVTDMTALGADNRLTQQTTNILNENNGIHVSRENSGKHIKTDLCKFFVTKSDVTDPEESAGVVGSLAINVTDMTPLDADNRLTQQTKNIPNENTNIHVSRENSSEHIKTDLCKFIVTKSDVTDPEESAGVVGSLAINVTDMTALGADNRLTQQTTNILNENNGIHVSRENSGKHIKTDLCKFIVTKSDVTDPEESAGVVGSLAINVTDMTALGADNRLTQQTTNILNENNGIHVSRENSSEHIKTDLCKFIVTKSDVTDPEESAGVVGSLAINVTDMTPPDADNRLTQQTKNIPNENTNIHVSRENSSEHIKTDLCKFIVTKSDVTDPEESGGVVGSLAINVTDMTPPDADNRLTQQTKNIPNENTNIHVSRENSSEHIKTDLCKFIVTKSDVTDPEESGGVVGSLAINVKDMNALSADNRLTQQTENIPCERTENLSEKVKTDICELRVSKFDYIAQETTHYWKDAPNNLLIDGDDLSTDYTENIHLNSANKNEIISENVKRDECITKYETIYQNTAATHSDKDTTKSVIKNLVINVTNVNTEHAIQLNVENKDLIENTPPPAKKQKLNASYCSSSYSRSHATDLDVAESSKVKMDLKSNVSDDTEQYEFSNQVIFDLINDLVDRVASSVSILKSECVPSFEDYFSAEVKTPKETSIVQFSISTKTDSGLTLLKEEFKGERIENSAIFAHTRKESICGDACQSNVPQNSGEVYNVTASKFENHYEPINGFNTLSENILDNIICAEGSENASTSEIKTEPSDTPTGGDHTYTRDPLVRGRHEEKEVLSTSQFTDSNVSLEYALDEILDFIQINNDPVNSILGSQFSLTLEDGNTTVPIDASNIEICDQPSGSSWDSWQNSAKGNIGENPCPGNTSNLEKESSAPGINQNIEATWSSESPKVVVEPQPNFNEVMDFSYLTYPSTPSIEKPFAYDDVENEDISKCPVESSIDQLLKLSDHLVNQMKDDEAATVDKKKSKKPEEDKSQIPKDKNKKSNSRQPVKSEVPITPQRRLGRREKPPHAITRKKETSYSANENSRIVENEKNISEEQKKNHCHQKGNLPDLGTDSKSNLKFSEYSKAKKKPVAETTICPERGSRTVRSPMYVTDVKEPVENVDSVFSVQETSPLLLNITKRDSKSLIDLGLSTCQSFKSKYSCNEKNRFADNRSTNHMPMKRNSEENIQATRIKRQKTVDINYRDSRSHRRESTANASETSPDTSWYENVEKQCGTEIWIATTPKCTSRKIRRKNQH